MEIFDSINRGSFGFTEYNDIPSFKAAVEHRRPDVTTRMIVLTFFESVEIDRTVLGYLALRFNFDPVFLYDLFNFRFDYFDLQTDKLFEDEWAVHVRSQKPCFIKGGTSLFSFQYFFVYDEEGRSDLHAGAGSTSKSEGISISTDEG
jgi:hypothetical protein